MSWNTVDYFIITLIVIGGISGFKQGFIKAVGSLFGMLAGLMFAYIYYTHCALYLEEYYGISSALASIIRDRVPITVLHINTTLAGVEFADTAQYLAYLTVLTASFILIYLLSSRIMMFLWKGLDHLFSWGILAAANKSLGMLLNIFKTVIVLMVIAGLIYPALEMASKLGFFLALVAYQGLHDSILTSYFLIYFDFLKEMMPLKL